MSNGKVSEPKLPEYLFYLILVLIITFLLLSLFIKFPLSSNQLLVVGLAVLGSYSLVEEAFKARKESAVGKHRLTVVSSLLTVVATVVVFLIVFSIETLLSLVSIVVVIYTFFVILRLVNRRSKSRETTYPKNSLLASHNA